MNYDNNVATKSGPLITMFQRIEQLQQEQLRAKEEEQRKRNGSTFAFVFQRLGGS
jgi:hypothetical protein